jgi:hypothetical protein
MALAFPLSSSHHIVPMPEESESEAFSREIAVLSFIFSHREDQILSKVPNLLILPPYIDEMRAELTLVNHHLIKVDNLVRILRKLRDKFFVVGRYADPRIDNITDHFIRGNAISRPEWNYVAEYLKAAYKHYLAIIVSSAYGGAPFLRLLIEQEVIRGWRSYFHQFYSNQKLKKMNFDSAFDSENISRRLPEYLSRISKAESRKKPEKAYPNRTDAAACIMLKALNEILQEEQSSIILISHSRAIADAVDPIKVTINRESEVVPGVRDLDYFWLYYVNMYLYYRKKSINEMLSAINDMNQTMLEFRQLYKAVCKESPKSETSVRMIVSRLRKVKEYMGYLGNVSLAAQTNSNLFQLLDNMSSGSKTIAEFYNGREMAKRMFEILTNEEMISVLGDKQERFSREILNIEGLRDLIHHLR